MKVVNLSKNQRFLIDDECFLIKKGKVISKDILKNGKAVGHELFVTKGEVIGNFFSRLNKEENFELMSVEVEALEETELEEINIKKDLVEEDDSFKKILSQLSKRMLLKYYQELYDTKGYILAVLKFYAGKKRILNKKEIKYDRFSNISRSRFYKIYSELKNEEYLIEEGDILKLNSVKINQYLRKFSV